MISNVLSWIIFLPIIGAVLVLLIPRSEKQANIIRWISAVFTGLQVVLAIYIFIKFNRDTSTMQFVEQVRWIPSYNIWYFVGIDGLSVSMVLLTALLSFLCIFAAWNIERAVKGYFTLFLLLDTGMMGVFCALDFFLFYVFWEVMLLPMYFLIGIWGGPRREYAAIKFFLYTLLGSVLILLAMLVFYFNVTDPDTGRHTFNMLHMMNQSLHHGILNSFNVRLLVFAALYIGFAIKIPAFPFHTWLPDAHVEAPTPISVILAGILLKMGTYGLLRVSYPILPDAMKYKPFAYGFVTIAVINIVYGALCAMAQKDLKKLVAYSSIGHMGVVMLGMAGLTPLGMNGAVLQMFNHGTVTAMLFLLVGVIYDRAHHREIDGFGGLAHRMPIYTGIVTVAFFANLGLPGLSSFISEAFSFLGAFSSTAFNLKIYTIISTLGIVLVAGYMLWTLQRMFFGTLNPKYANLPEINGRELFTLVPLAAIIVLLGVYPTPVLDLLKETMNNLVAVMQKAPAVMWGMQ
ncbi:MAG: NADH-quinone oxidoreductase subunit M [candidate division KSB1 bacterium]|nr:NADH-quinone oxidoreductase subunit M [candidate division KSB1 bacterium]MDZ7302103.1 NADH-quinone oxidoreductase subunit M [candidate division KSB1 bacterium]MDZ7311144.1 NADH-quinone oxidoreductase subunit M [candidate division KSB1 bacterium]